MTSDPLEEMKSAILSEASRTDGGRPWTTDVGLLGLVYGLTLLGALGVSGSLLGHSPNFHGPSPLVLGVAIGGALVGAVIPGPSARRWFSLAVASGAIATLLHLWGFLRAPSTSFWADADCALAELGVAIVPGVATIWLSRHFASSRSRAALGGLAAAMTGIFVLDLTCPADGIGHVLLFHLVPAALVVLLAIWARHKTSTLTHVP